MHAHPLHGLRGTLAMLSTFAFLASQKPPDPSRGSQSRTVKYVGTAPSGGSTRPPCQGGRRRGERGPGGGAWLCVVSCGCREAVSVIAQPGPQSLRPRSASQRIAAPVAPGGRCQAAGGHGGAERRDAGRDAFGDAPGRVRSPLCRSLRLRSAAPARSSPSLADSSACSAPRPSRASL